MSMIVSAVLLMGITGVLLGVMIALFARLFKTPVDARAELVQELLPGANCGGCGKAGCADFAKSVVAGENPPSRCPVSSQEQINAIAMALGISAAAAPRKRAVVRCGGDMFQTVSKVHYNGVTDCAAASLVAGGPKGCRYGCLGLGSCANVCPFGAIEIVNNLALVHRELCVGCGKCVEACPRGVIALVAMTPLITIQILGLIYKIRSKQNGAEEPDGDVGSQTAAEVSDPSDDDVIEL